MNPLFFPQTHTHTHTVWVEESYSLWCRPTWHVKVNTRIANHTLVSSFWGLPVTCLFAFFYPLQKLPVSTHKETHFPAQMWQNIVSPCRRHKEAGWTKNVFSLTPFIPFTLTESQSPGVCLLLTPISLLAYVQLARKHLSANLWKTLLNFIFLLLASLNA